MMETINLNNSDELRHYAVFIQQLAALRDGRALDGDEPIPSMLAPTRDAEEGPAGQAPQDGYGEVPGGSAARREGPQG